MNSIKNLFQKHKAQWLEKAFVLDFIFGIVFLFISLFINYFANHYTLTHASNSATDLLLDNLPIVNMELVFSYGASLFIMLLVLVLLLKPHKITFVLKSIALFILIRSIFITFTHLASPLPLSHLISDSEIDELLRKMSSGNDLFFSGHTGFPFLMALIFWKEKAWRFLFLLSSIIGATAVILGHLHYSIDVFSAFFITYAIFEIGKKIFPKDYKRSLNI